MRFPVEVYANSIAWSPDSRMIAANDQRGHFVYNWNVSQERMTFKTPNTAGIFQGLSFTADGRFLMGAATDQINSICFSVWDAVSGHKIRDVFGPDVENGKRGTDSANRILRSLDSTSVIALLGGGGYAIFNTATWTLTSYHDEPFGRTSAGRYPQARDAALSPDGRYLAFNSETYNSDPHTKVGHGDLLGNIQIWSAENHRLVKVFKADPYEERRSFVSGRATAKALSFSPDGAFLAVGTSVNDDTNDKQLHIWRSSTWTYVRSYVTGNRRNIWSLSYSPDGRYLATVAADEHSIRVWSTQTSSVIKELSTWPNKMSVVSFSPDSRFLASGGEAEVVIYDVDSL